MLENCPLARGLDGGPCWLCSEYRGELVCGMQTKDQLIADHEICPRDVAQLHKGRAHELWLREKYRARGIDRPSWPVGVGNYGKHEIIAMWGEQ